VEHLCDNTPGFTTIIVVSQNLVRGRGAGVRKDPGSGLLSGLQQRGAPLFSWRTHTLDSLSNVNNWKLSFPTLKYNVNDGKMPLFHTVPRGFPANLPMMMDQSALLCTFSDISMFLCRKLTYVFQSIRLSARNTTICR
jgi:hypothetical protein